MQKERSFLTCLEKTKMKSNPVMNLHSLQSIRNHGKNEGEEGEMMAQILMLVTVYQAINEILSSCE